jgi:hypothetical protein
MLPLAIAPPCPPLAVTPPVPVAEFPLAVLRRSVSAAVLYMAPPLELVNAPPIAFATAALPSTALRLRVSVPRFMIAPPKALLWLVAALALAVLPLKRLSVIASVAPLLFSIPPPSAEAFVPPLSVATLSVTVTPSRVSVPSFRTPPPWEPQAASQSPSAMLRSEIETVAPEETIRTCTAALPLISSWLAPGPSTLTSPAMAGRVLPRVIVLAPGRPKSIRSTVGLGSPATQAPLTALSLAALIASRSVQSAADTSSFVSTVIVAASASAARGARRPRSAPRRRAPSATTDPIRASPTPSYFLLNRPWPTSPSRGNRLSGSCHLSLFRPDGATALARARDWRRSAGARRSPWSPGETRVPLLVWWSRR